MNSSKVRRGVTVAVAAAAAAAMLITAGCGSSDSPSSGEAAPQASSTAAASTTTTPPTAEQSNVAVAEPAEPGSGAGIRVGYLAPDESLPIPHVISEGIREQARRAGVNLTLCDSHGDSGATLNCARLFKAKRVQGIVNFQLDSAIAPSVCKAGPQGVPVFAVDVPQPPCQTTMTGSDNAAGGYVGGVALGKYFKEKFDCEYDAFIELTVPAVGEINKSRMGGFRQGFESYCGTIHDSREVPYEISPESARATVADALTALPTAKRIAMTSMDDSGLIGAYSAAKAAGRQDQVYAASLGMALESQRCTMMSTPTWVASTGIFPERYGMIAIPYIIKAVKGEDVGAELHVEHVALTKENMAQYYPDDAC